MEVLFLVNLLHALHQAFPTQALKNELCHSFITINKCWKSHNCPGIHPYDKAFYRYQSYEQKRLRDLRLRQPPSPSPKNTPVQDAGPVATTAPTNPVSLHDNRFSDTSSVSEELNVPGRWDPDTGFWENYSDNKAWSDDSDVTTDDMQTSPKGTGGRIPDSVLASPTQVLPVKEQKHPRPKYNERCRRWLWNECNLGYQCKFVHEDLEYDDSPVSFDLLPCNQFFFMSIF